MEGKINNSNLLKMIGREVKAYQGGPESCNGKLVDVKSDYIILDSDKDGLIYYQTKHIKSLIEDSKTSMFQDVNEAIDGPNDKEDFKKLLKKLVGTVIKINRGGPESVKGTLLSVGKDLLVINSENGVVIYLNLEHIKSISLPGKNKSEKHKGDNKDKENKSCTETDSNPKTLVERDAEEESLNFIQVSSLDKLFEHLKYSFVTVNNKGPESIDGILVDTSNCLLTIVAKDSIFRISKFHIKSISQKKRNHSQNSKVENNNDNKNKNKDDEVSIVNAKKKKRNSRR